MKNASVTPFAFDELTREAPAPEPAPVFTQENLDNARRQGESAGRAEALAGLIKEQTDLMKALQAQLGAAAQAHEAALEEERSALKTIAEEFLTVICERYYEEHECAHATALLDQLLQSSADKSPAELLVSAQSFEKIEAQLQAIIQDKNIGAFINIAPSDKLAPGECRLEWRGGAITRALAPLREKIKALINAERPQNFDTEQPS